MTITEVLGDKLEKEENAPSLEHERETLRRQCYDLAKKRANIAKELKARVWNHCSRSLELLMSWD